MPVVLPLHACMGPFCVSDPAVAAIDQRADAPSVREYVAEAHNVGQLP